MKITEHYAESGVSTDLEQAAVAAINENIERVRDLDQLLTEGWAHDNGDATGRSYLYDEPWRWNEGQDMPTWPKGKRLYFKVA